MGKKIDELFIKALSAAKTKKKESKSMSEKAGIKRRRIQVNEPRDMGSSTTKFQKVSSGKNAMYSVVGEDICIMRKVTWRVGTVSKSGFTEVEYFAWIRSLVNGYADSWMYDIARGTTLKEVKSRVVLYLTDRDRGELGPRSKYGFFGDQRLVARE